MTPDLAAAFLALHDGPEPLLIPNPWDAGSARLLASLGFLALATTSSGFAATLGRADGSVSRDEAIAHGAAIAAAVDIPVSADLENGFAHDPADVAITVELAVEAGLAGCSIEDFSTDDDEPIYHHALAVERVAAAAIAAHSGNRRLVLTARAENYLHDRPDLADTISRLQAFADAGADVVYAPGLTSEADIAAVVGAVDVPVNVLVLAGGPSIARLAELGVRRISVGGALAYAALAAVVDAVAELRGGPTPDFFTRVRAGRAAAATAFS